jgi:hypothetical protein
VWDDEWVWDWWEEEGMNVEEMGGRMRVMRVRCERMRVGWNGM